MTDAPTFACIRDHHRIDALLRAAWQALTASRTAQAREALAALGRHLTGHLRLEEDLIFPTVERVVQDSAFPLTAALRRDHDRIRAQLDAATAALAGTDGDAGRRALADLEALLKQHATTEEEALYPVAERALSQSGVRLAR